MNGYLLDTSFVSVFAPGRFTLTVSFLDWVKRQEAQKNWYLSTVVLAEIERGISKARRTGAPAKADRLARWLEMTIEEFADRILPIDELAAREAGRLGDRTSARGNNPGFADILLAATARTNNLGVLTANVRHFAALEVEFYNPLAGDYPPS